MKRDQQSYAKHFAPNMAKTLSTAIIMTFGIMIAVEISSAQRPTGADYVMPYPYWKSGSYGWAEGLSEKGDPAFVTARKAVTDALRVMKRKTSPSAPEAISALAKQYHLLWKKEPTNPLALYRWGLCLYKTLPSGLSDKQVNQKLGSD